jgi:hypothetical protein
MPAMKFEIPIVIGEIPLGDYHADLAGRILYVHLNPSKAMLKKRTENANRQMLAFIQLEQIKDDDLAKNIQEQLGALERELWEWYAEIWSKGPPETVWTMDELAELSANAPDFLNWMIAKTTGLYTARRQAEKKS